MDDDELAIPDFLKMSKEERKKGWDDLRNQRKEESMKFAESLELEDGSVVKVEEKTLSHKLREYNAIVQELVGLGVVKKERTTFSTHVEADAAIERINSSLRAVKQGQKDERSLAGSVPKSNIPSTPQQKEVAVATAARKKTIVRAKTAEGRQFGKPAKVLAEFRQIKDGTARAHVLKLMDGRHTADQIASRVGIEKTVVKLHAYKLWSDCGIGYEIVNDKMTALYPKGKSYEAAIKKAE
jgi:hypothetical protein